MAVLVAISSIYKKCKISNHENISAKYLFMKRFIYFQPKH